MHFQGTTGHQRSKGVRDIAFTWMVLHSILRTHQGSANRASSPESYVVALQNEQGMYVLHENYNNFSREAKLQSHEGIGWTGWQDLRYVNQIP